MEVKNYRVHAKKNLFGVFSYEIKVLALFGILWIPFDEVKYDNRDIVEGILNDLDHPYLVEWLYD